MRRALLEHFPLAMMVSVLCTALVCCSPTRTEQIELPAISVETVTIDTPLRTLHLGRAPHISQETTRAENAPLAAYLSKQLGLRVDLVVPSDYDTVTSELASGAIDVAILPPLLYVIAKKRTPDLTLIAQLVVEGGGQFLSYIVTAADAPVHSLADLKGKRFAFVDKFSTTGYLLPLDLLSGSAIEPNRDFARVVFAGSHPEVVKLVITHKVDAGAIASTTFRQMRDARLKERLRILAKSDPVPCDAVVVRPNLPPEIVAKIRDTLLSLSTRTDEGRAVLDGATTTNGFIPVTDDAYDSVRGIAVRIDDR